LVKGKGPQRGEKGRFGVKWGRSEITGERNNRKAQAGVVNWSINDTQGKKKTRKCPGKLGDVSHGGQEKREMSSLLGGSCSTTSTWGKSKIGPILDRGTKIPLVHGERGGRSLPCDGETAQSGNMEQDPPHETSEQVGFVPENLQETKIKGNPQEKMAPQQNRLKLWGPGGWATHETGKREKTGKQQCLKRGANEGSGV